MNFKVGEKVIAIPGNNVKAGEWGQPLSTKTVYTVLAVAYCSGCGQQRINVQGALPSNEFYPTIRCESCGHEYPHNGLWWTRSKYFTRPISNSYKLEVSIPELLTITEPQYQ